MIDFVKTPHGLMPKTVADRMKRNEADAKAKRDAELLMFRDRVAHAFGLKAADLPIPTMDTIRKAAAAAKAKFSSAELARVYPCRECRVAHDDRYKVACAETGAVACYVTVSFRGCPQLKPRLIVG